MKKTDKTPPAYQGLGKVDPRIENRREMGIDEGPYKHETSYAELRAGTGKSKRH